MIIRIYDYNGKGKLVKIPDDCEYIEFDILNGDMVLTYPIQVDACDEPRKWIENEGHYKLTKDKFNKLWHLKRDVWENFGIMIVFIYMKVINYAYREVVSTDIKYLGLLEE